MNLDYICLAPGFAKEVLEIYQTWDGKETLPWKIKELMMVLQIEVSRRYKPDILPVESKSQRVLKDARLDGMKLTRP